jgi:hypothetical protein
VFSSTQYSNGGIVSSVNPRLYSSNDDPLSQGSSLVSHIKRQQTAGHPMAGIFSGQTSMKPYSPTGFHFPNKGGRNFNPRTAGNSKVSGWSQSQHRRQNIIKKAQMTLEEIHENAIARRYERVIASAGNNPGIIRDSEEAQVF